MSDLGIGSVFAGKYEIQRILGKGTTAVVYEAYDRFLQRSVALKVLHPHMAEDKEPVERFVREAQSLVQIRHPVIVHVIDAGNRDGQFYMVQELIEGKELEDAIDEDSLTPEDIIEIGAQLCEGLGAVHSLGLVHRDVKPQNVFITRVDGRLHVKLVDFGIAKTYLSEALTAPGITVGTPQFMAPEQAMGKELDGRTDLFALGCLLFNAATGSPPFDAVGVQELLLKVAYERAPLLANEMPDLPENLRVAVDVALEPEPGDRWADANEMASALRAGG